MATDTTAALRILFGADTRQFDKALIQSTKRLRATGKKMQSIGRGLTVGLTAPLTAIGVSSFRTARDFEFSMQRVAAVSGATETQLQALSAQARELGRTTVFTAADVAGLQESFARLGFSTSEIQKVTEGTLALPSIRNRPSTAADVAGATLRAFGLDASETGRVTDVWLPACQQRTRHVVVRESMKFVAPRLCWV